MSETITTEEIAGHYSAAGDSVTVINELVALDTLNDELKDSVSRNVAHLKLMVDKDYWTTEDLSPFNAAITAGEAALTT